MTNEERKNLYMNRNIKLSPSLIALTWDVIFIWTISTLYLTTVKGFSNSQAVALDSILMLAGCLMVVPVNKLMQNVKPITATRIGLFGYAAFLLLNIFGTTFPIFIFAQFFLAFGYAVLGVKTNLVLTESLTVIKRDKDYERIYGKGISLLYIIEFFGAIGITYVFNWKAEAAYIVSLCVVGIALILTFMFKDPAKFMDKNVNIPAKEEIDSVVKKPDSYVKILKSGFFISLLIYGFFFRGLVSITGSSFKIYLNELVATDMIPITLYGYIYAISRLVNSIVSKYQFKFNLKWGVRTLLIINSLAVLGFVGTGLLYILYPGSYVAMVGIILLCYVLCCLRMPNHIFLNNYLQVCTSTKNIERAYSIRVMVEYLGYAVISFVYSFLLSAFGDNFGLTNLTYIGIFVIPLVVSLIIFIRALCKKYAQKYTIIKSEYTED